MQRRLACISLALASVIFTACDQTVTDGEDVSELSSSSAVVVQWNEIAVQTIGAQPPFPSTRFMATVSVAVFEAVNAITGEFEPYLGTITAPQGASPEAAAIIAAHDVLKGFFPAAAGNLDAQRDASLAAIPDGQSKTDGMAVGAAAAAAMLAARTNDGSAPPLFHTPPDADPGEWQITVGCPPAGGAFKHWQNVKPFVIESSSQFRSEPPPPLTSRHYATDFNEVKLLGANTSTERPQDRADVARIYAAQPPHVGWNSIARQLVIANPKTESMTSTARTFALLNMTLSDGHITVMESKYYYTLWRPETAIPRAAEDGNHRTTASAFTPFVTTPCFPSYPSAHGSGAGGASTVLARIYGVGHHDLVNSDPSVPGVTLHYRNLKDIVRDVSDARVYGGIHFRYDQDAAEDMGKQVAKYNLRNSLRKIGDDDCDD
jgi:hypothetical protein